MAQHVRKGRSATFLMTMLLLTTWLPFGQPVSVGAREHSRSPLPVAIQRSYFGEDRASYLSEISDLIVTGKIIRVETASEGWRGAVHPSADLQPDKRLVLTVTIEDVLKGGKLAGRTATLDVLAIPEPSDVRIDPAALQAQRDALLKELGGKLEEVQLKLFSSELTMTKRFIFFLKALDSSQGQSNRQQQNRSSVIYQYMNALEVESRAVDLVKHYIDLAQIRDMERREQAIVTSALSLLRDPQTPERFTEDALKDLVFLRMKPATKWLSETEGEELVRILTDPKRPDIIRSWASEVIRGLIESGQQVNPFPLLGVLEDSSDDVGRRLGVIYLLEQMNTPEIREAVTAILAKEPKTEEDKTVWRALARSPLSKQQ